MVSPNSESESAPDGVELSQHIPSASGSGAMPTTANARAKCHITALEDELEIMRQERGMKQRKTTYHAAQGRAIHCLIILYATMEDLISENDRRYEDQSEDAATPAQDRMQRSYIELSWALPWLHRKLGTLEHEDCEDMLRKLKKGADTARLKDLVATWVNQEFRPSPLIKPDDKCLHGFASDVCSKLLCPAEWDWDQNHIKVGIHNRMSEFIVSENSWPLFLYEGYTVNCENLEEGLFKSKLLVMACKAIFTSPSSAKEAEGDGDGAGIIENDRRAQRESDQEKVKICVALIINMKKLPLVLSPMLFVKVLEQCCGLFEDAPSPITQHRVDKLLEWWTRKIFGMNHHEDLTPDVVSQMSVNTLAQQRKALEDTAFDSD